MIHHEVVVEDTEVEGVVAGTAVVQGVAGVVVVVSIWPVSIIVLRRYWLLDTLQMKKIKYLHISM